MKEQKYDYGMVGLGTMGSNLVCNMSDNGFSVIGFDKNDAQVAALNIQASSDKVFATSNLDEFLKSLKSPKVILMLVPAGRIVDVVINELQPFLSKDDLLLDCGNSHFTDTNRRIEELKTSGIHFMGVGISGGELGARYGASIMPGGPKEVYDRVAKMLEAVSAKVNEVPCVTWLGTGSSGHYVKMVHNGIEYGLMQLIAESYQLLKDVGKLNNQELESVFSKWNKGILQSFLIEITADIFSQKDDLSTNDLVDMIRDSAKQKGTGGWTSEDGINLQVPIPVIDIAVAMRDMSALKEEREIAEKKLTGPQIEPTDDKTVLIDSLEQAFYFAMITVYAQGMALLQTASTKYEYGLNPQNIAKIWRGGCIIRATLLEDMYTAFSQEANLQNLMTSTLFAEKLEYSQKGMRLIIGQAVANGIPVPAMMMSLAYYDSYRSAWLPANLIQAQRDYFGAHTYERIDRESVFHTQWNQKNS